MQAPPKPDFRMRDSYEVRVCARCPNALDPLEGVADRIESMIEESGWRREKLMAHSRLKVAISACPNACSQVQIADLGIIVYSFPRLKGDCRACGLCERVCEENAVIVDDIARFDYDKCVGCGLCVRVCPSRALVGEKRYKVLAGGRLGRHPRLAEEVLNTDSLEEALEAVKLGIETSAREGKRLSHIENGVERLRRAIESMLRRSRRSRS